MDWGDDDTVEEVCNFDGDDDFGNDNDNGNDDDDDDDDENDDDSSGCGGGDWLTFVLKVSEECLLPRSFLTGNRKRLDGDLACSQTIHHPTS